MRFFLHLILQWIQQILDDYLSLDWGPLPLQMDLAAKSQHYERRRNGVRPRKAHFLERVRA